MSSQANLIRKDVVIVGAGPAGLSALLWCVDLGLDAAIVEQRLEPGGQMLAIHNPITNYLGLETRNGREMRDRFVEHADKLLKSQFIGVTATAIDVETKIVKLSDGRSIEAAAVVLATGVRRRRLGIEGESEFAGKGVLESGAKEKESLKGKRVVIVGGGDAALENAIILSEYASQISIIHRRGTFSARPDFVTATARLTNVRIEFDAGLVKILGKDRVEAVEFVQLPSGKIETVPTDAVLIRVGVEPNSDLIRGRVAVDDRSYILTTHDCETSVAGIYAIGDVANPSSPTISTATGDGATAVKAIYTQIGT